MRNYTPKRQAGMTLIELTVVLLILVGLAGLLIPYVGSFVQKTHDSTSSNNLAQLNNAFVRYVAENNMLPQHMDALVNATGGAGTGLACSGANVQWGPYCGLLDTGMFEAVTYDAATLPIALNSVINSKIRMVVNNNESAPNKTFGSYTGMVNLMDPATAVFHGVKVIGMRDATGAPIVPTPMNGAIESHLAAALGKDPMDYDAQCYDYVAFGLGDANGLVTKTIAASPVNYPEDATKSPVEYYNHYIAIVQVDKANSGTGYMGRACSSVTEPAKFLGTVMNVPASANSHLIGVNSSLASAYEHQLADK